MKVYMIPHPILTRAKISPAVKKKIYTLLCFGFIDPIKGFDIAIKAFKGVKNFRLVMVGSLYMKKKEQRGHLSQLKQLARQYSNIELSIGFATESEKEFYFKRADFILIPYRKIEQSGILCEAWGFGKIPICSDIPPFKEEIGNNKYGILFKTENPTDLRNQAIYISKNINKQKEILNNIKTLRKARSYGETTKQYLKYMKQ